VDVAAGAALLLLYLALMSGHLFSVDGLEMYRQGIALAHGSVHFLEPLHWGALATDNSKYGIGLSLAYVPALLALGWIPGLHPSTGVEFDLLFRDPLYAVAGAPLHALVTAAAAVLTARVARRLGAGDRGAIWALVLFGIGSPALIYARGDWAQPLTALCWAGALAGALRPGRGGLAVMALGIAAAVLTRVVDGGLVVPIAIGLAWWSRGRAAGPLVASAAGFGAGLAGNLLVAWARYGSPLITGYEGEGWTTPPLVGLLGATLSPGRGLAWEFPALLLTLAGTAMLARSGRAVPALLLGGLAAAELVNTALWNTWWGGANWGLRLFVPGLVPLAAVAGLAAGRLRAPASAGTWVVLAGGLLFSGTCVVADVFSGLPGETNSSTANFHLHAYPPLGAWPGVQRVLGNGMDDHLSIDILWLRLAGAGHSWVPLLAMAALLAGAAACAWVARHWLRAARSPALTTAAEPGGDTPAVPA
jgi:hypothetical protein